MPDDQIAERINRTNTIDFSIILINYNSEPYIEPCLHQIWAAGFNGSIEIIVVNNLATDASLDLLKQQPKITLINPGKNLGYSGGNNLGISRSRGKYVFCLNFDCLLTDGFLQKVYDAFESNPQVGMISGKLRKLFNMQPTKYLDSTGIDFTTLVPADRGEWQYDVGQFDAMTNIFGPSGAAGCYKRKALESVTYRKNQYFDEQMFMYCEDIDLAWRLNLAGWRGLYVPDALAYHERGATRKEDFWKKVWYQLNGSCNRYFTILKNIRRKDIKGRLNKLLFQELRIHAAFCRLNPARWATLGYVMLRLGELVLRPSFIEKRNLAHCWENGDHLDLSLDTDFWKALQEKRSQAPLNDDCRPHSGSGVKFVIDKQSWRAFSRGFQDATWNTNGFFFSGTSKKKSYLEIRIPDEYQSKIKNLHLYIDLNADTDVFFDIHVFSDNGMKTRSDWRVFSSGKGLFVFDLIKTDLVPGSDNISVWQGPWVALRLNISSMRGRRINIRKIFFDEKRKPFSTGR
ncbi:MAG: glycosyltransferase family 2 protein [Nitrospinales bacterium]